MTLHHADGSVPSVLQKASRALNRTAPPTAAPSLADIDQSVARLFPPDADVVDSFIRNGSAVQLHIERADKSSLPEKIIAVLNLRNCKSVGIGNSPLLDSFDFAAKLNSAGFSAKTWADLTLDAAYDLDAGITDAWAGVAEMGSIAILPTPGVGRALSLVPLTHIAIIESEKILPDLIDLYNKTSQDPAATNVTLITGPSKTGDIEGILVTGVHGPGHVHIFVLQ